MNFKRFVPFLAAFVLPIIGVYAWWGGFSPVRIEPEALRGPYRYAYLEHRGDYSKLTDKQAEADKALRAQGIRPGHAISVLYSNPDAVNVNDRLSRTGFLLPEGAPVQAPLKVDEIPARPVLVATVRAAVLLAPSRAYAALDRYMQARGRGIRMPTVEIYEASGSPLAMGALSVEVPR